MASNRDRTSGPLGIINVKSDTLPAGPVLFTATRVESGMRREFDGEGKVPCFNWQLQTPEGKKHNTRTGVAYGNPDADLTRMLNAMYGRKLTDDEVRQFDARQTIGTMPFMAILITEYNDSGEPYNKIAGWGTVDDYNEIVKKSGNKS